MYHLCNNQPPCHSERSGTDIENQAIKSIIAAESNPEGAPAGGISALESGIISQISERQWHYVRTLPINALKVLGESRGASFKKPLWRIPRNPRAPHTRMRAGNRTEGRDGGDRETKARTPLRQRQAGGVRQGRRELRDVWLRSGLNPSAAARRETDSPCDSLREARPVRNRRTGHPCGTLVCENTNKRI